MNRMRLGNQLNRIISFNQFMKTLVSYPALNFPTRQF